MMADSKNENNLGFNCLLIVSALIIIAWVILEIKIKNHELFENQQVFEKAFTGQLVHHQYFTFYGTRTNVTDWGFLMLRIVPTSILFLLWLIFAILDTRTELCKPLTEEQYQKWCNDAWVHIIFVSFMPYNLKNYIQHDMNSFLLVRNEQKIWRLFKLNSRGQKGWDADQWKSDESEIKISDVEGLEKIIKELPDVLPENLPPGEKNYVKARILTLFNTKSEN